MFSVPLATFQTATLLDSAEWNIPLSQIVLEDSTSLEFSL